MFFISNMITNTIPMKKECSEFVQNLSKKLTVQIPDNGNVRKVIQKMSVSGRCNLSGNRLEFVQVQNLSSFICLEFIQNFLCLEFVQFYLSRICPEFFHVQNMSRKNFWNFSCPEFVRFIYPEFVQIFCMFRICPENFSGIFFMSSFLG